MTDSICPSTSILIHVIIIWPWLELFISSCGIILTVMTSHIWLMELWALSSFGQNGGQSLKKYLLNNPNENFPDTSRNKCDRFMRIPPIIGDNGFSIPFLFILLFLLGVPRVRMQGVRADIDVEMRAMKYDRYKCRYTAPYPGK